MANFGSVSDEVQELVNRISNETGLNKLIDIETVSVNKSKKIIDIKRCPALGEHVARKRDVVCVIVYEKAFERLHSEEQELLMKDAFNAVSYDLEKDKINIGCPQMIISCEGRRKYGEKLVDAYEHGITTIQIIAEEEKEAKEAAKQAKKSKKKF